MTPEDTSYNPEGPKYAHAEAILDILNKPWVEETVVLQILAKKAQGYVDKFGPEILKNLTPKLREAYEQSLKTE